MPGKKTEPLGFAFYPYQMLYLIDHAANRWCIFQLACTTDFIQPKPDKGFAL
jgi:hypothetical protein